MNKKLIPLYVLSVFLLSVLGCGYHIGSSIMNPQIKTIAIAPVKNETVVPLVSAYLRSSLSEQFMVDNSLKVKQINEADCILYAQVLEVENTSTSEDSSDGALRYRPAEWQIKVTIEYNVIIPGAKEPLIQTREVSGSALYQVTADQNISRRYGLEQACYQASKEIVEYIVEGW